MLASWIERHQHNVITYLQEGNRLLKAQLGGRQLWLIDTERRCLAACAHPLGRKRLQEVATIATPDTLLCWYRRLIAQKFNGSHHCRQCGRPRVAEEIEQEEALDQVLLLSAQVLRHVMQEYLVHYHHEWNHQGLGNRLIAPEAGIATAGSQVVGRDRLGGLLTYYYWDAA
jgi:hypothetical protein